MDDEEFKEFMAAQIEEIEKHKWIESEKAKRDLGMFACFDWIHKYASKFYEYWTKRK